MLFWLWSVQLYKVNAAFSQTLLSWLNRLICLHFSTTFWLSQSVKHVRRLEQNHWSLQLLAINSSRGADSAFLIVQLTARSWLILSLPLVQLVMAKGCCSITELVGWELADRSVLGVHLSATLVSFLTILLSFKQLISSIHKIIYFERRKISLICLLVSCKQISRHLVHILSIIHFLRTQILYGH